MVQNYESPLENYMVVSRAAEFLEAFATLHSYSHFGPNIFLKQFQSPFLSYVTCKQTSHKGIDINAVSDYEVNTSRSSERCSVSILGLGTALSNWV